MNNETAISYDGSESNSEIIQDLFERCKYLEDKISDTCFDEYLLKFHPEFRSDDK